MAKTHQEKPIPIEFEEDKGVTRSSKAMFNKESIEQLLKDARSWLNKNKGKSCKQKLIKIEQTLGVTMSNSNNFAWLFNPRNNHAPFSDIAAKYSIKVGGHHGLKEKEIQENYFRDMTEDEKG